MQMAIYEFDVIPTDQDGRNVFNNDTKTWQDIETFLAARGVLGWEFVGFLCTTRPRRIVLSKTAIETLYAGTITVGTAAVALTADHNIVEIIVQADANNSNNLFVGNATTQAIKLSSGKDIKISIDSVSKVYVRGGAAGQVANWLATGR